MQQRMPENWDQIVSTMRAWCVRTFGFDPHTVVLEGRGGQARLPVPPWAGCGQPQLSAAPGEPAPAHNAHTSDFQRVDWNGRRYFLTPKQAKVVSVLWQAWEEGGEEIAQDVLLRAADSDGVRLVDLFKRSEAWGNLIVSPRPGFYRLAEVGDG